MKNIKKFDDFLNLNEHHGDEWPPEFLNQTLDQFLTRLKDIDETKYETVESIISSIIDEF